MVLELSCAGIYISFHFLLLVVGIPNYLFAMLTVTYAVMKCTIAKATCIMCRVTVLDS